VIGKTFGPWFWVHAAYTYLLLSLTIYLFLAALRASPFSHRQTLVLLIGTLLPLVGQHFGIMLVATSVP
jgi:hypothetical protein